MRGGYPLRPGGWVSICESVGVNLRLIDWNTVRFYFCICERKVPLQDLSDTLKSCEHFTAELHLCCLGYKFELLYHDHRNNSKYMLQISLVWLRVKQVLHTGKSTGISLSWSCKTTTPSMKLWKLSVRIGLIHAISVYIRFVVCISLDWELCE